MTTRLLAIIDPGCPASTRIRVAQFESYLQSKAVELEIVDWPRKGSEHGGAMDTLLERVTLSDAVVLQRYLPNSTVLREIRRRARRLTYDFDDAVIYSESTRGKPHLKLRRLWRFRQMMRCCDAVTAGNDYLGAIARRYGASEVRTLPTTVDFRSCESKVANMDSFVACGSVPAPGRQIANDPVVGWIGLPSTLPYLARLRRPLERLCEEVVGLKVRVISSQRPDLGEASVEYVEWTPQAEVRELKRMHVGLAPLLDDLWTRGKCARRLTQYMAAGIPSVASPVGAQAEITDYGAALPAVSDAEWVGAVRRILADARTWRHGLSLAAGKWSESVSPRRYGPNQCVIFGAERARARGIWPSTIPFHFATSSKSSNFASTSLILWWIFSYSSRRTKPNRASPSRSTLRKTPIASRLLLTRSFTSWWRNGLSRKAPGCVSASSATKFAAV